MLNIPEHICPVKTAFHPGEIMNELAFLIDDYRAQCAPEDQQMLIALLRDAQEACDCRSDPSDMRGGVGSLAEQGLLAGFSGREQSEQEKPVFSSAEGNAKKRLLTEPLFCMLSAGS